MSERLEILVVGPEPDRAELAERLGQLGRLDVVEGDPKLGDLVSFIAAEGDRFDTIFFVGHAYPVTLGAIALMPKRAVLIPLIGDPGELDLDFRRYVFRLPRTHGFRALGEREAVRRHVDIEAVPFEIVGERLDDLEALERLIAPAPRTSRPCVAVYRRGPAWDHAKPLAEQANVGSHINFLGGLIARGTVERAGPFHGGADLVEADPVGLVVFATADPGAADRVLEDDPALQTGLMEYDLYSWRI